MVIIYATQYDMIGADMLGLGLQAWPSTSRVQAPYQLSISRNRYNGSNITSVTFHLFFKRNSRTLSLHLLLPRVLGFFVPSAVTDGGGDDGEEITISFNHDGRRDDSADSNSADHQIIRRYTLKDLAAVISSLSGRRTVLVR